MKKPLLLLVSFYSLCLLSACGGGGSTLLSATHLSVTAPATATAGTAFNFTATALDASNNVVASYSGTVHFTSTDGHALPFTDSKLTNGVGTFSATLNTAGNQTITATDTVTASITGTSNSIIVGGSSAANPVPFINQPLSPAAMLPGGPGFTLTVNGTGFVSGSVVTWNSSARATSIVSESKLTATILAADIASFDTASVTVVNPGPGGGTSNVVFFEITRPTSSVALSVTSQFAVGTSPRLVAAGDFNRDGELDLIVADTFNNDVSVLIGNGDGTFKPAMHFATGTFPFSAVTGDFNGDGNLDLAVTNSASNNVSILLGNGDGTFQPAVNYGTGMNPASVAVGDFNGHGKLDLAVANSGSDDVSILLNNGDGTFRPAVAFGAGQQPESLAVGDFNGDNKIDLAAANIGGDNVSVLFGNGDGTFQAPVDYPVGTEPISLVAGDFNGDGKLDLASANLGSDDVSVLLGNGDGTFQASVSYGAGSGPSSLALGDFNGDGKLDLAVPNRSSSNVSLLLGNSDGTFQPAVDFTAGQRPDSLALGDFNGDGRLDMAAGDSTGSLVSILLQPGLVTGPNTILSASNITFPNQLLGTTSSAQTVTMINNGTQTLNISNISATSSFEETNTCASSLAASASCSINVTFIPGAIDLVTGTLSITDNAPGSPQTVVLDGTGTIVKLDPAGMKFICNTHLPGGCQLKPRTATLTNTGNTTLTITSITIGGFFSETNTCPASLGAGVSCTITVTAIRGPTFSSGNVLVNDNGGGSPQRIALTFYEF